MRPARALVLSPDTAVRDDVARVLLATQPRISKRDCRPRALSTADESARVCAEALDLVVMHDCYIPAIAPQPPSSYIRHKTNSRQESRR